MTIGWLWAAAAALVAVTAAVLRARTPRRRRMRVLGAPRRHGRTGAVSGHGAASRAGVPGGNPDGGSPGRPVRFPVMVARSVPTPAVALLAGGAGLAAGGPVAAFVVAAYTALLVRGARHRQLARRRTGLRAGELDALCAFAADLRAGLPPVLLGGVGPDAGRAGANPRPRAGADGWAPAPDDPVRHRVTDYRVSCLASAAVGLAESTGAPLADLIERIEADARAADRAAATASAQAAGVRATAWLLAALPVGGISLGYGIGVDPLRVLLHTPAGACCAVSAVLLQVTGLLWAERLARLPGLPPVRPGRGAGRPGTLARAVARYPRRPLGTLVGALVGVATALLVGGWPGVVCGTVAAVGTDRALGRVEPASVRAERAHCAAALPLAVDLLAAALRSGAPTYRAVAAVAAALGGPLGERCARVARSLRLGAEPVEAWDHLADIPNAARLTVAAIRSSTSGSALSGVLTRLADDLRADRAAAAEAAARRAGVLIVLPLGLCFLPAFLLAGLAPVVVAVLGDVLQ